MSSSIVRVISSILLLPPALQPVHCPRAVAILLLLQTLQLLHFPLRQLTKFPWRNIQNQRSQPHPPDLLHIESHALKHPPDLPIAPLNQNHLVPGIGPIFHEANFRGRRLHPLPVLQLNRNSRPQTLDRLLLRFPADFYQIRLRHVRTRLHQLLRQRPVVGHQQQTFAGIVQPPHRIHTLRTLLHQLHHRQASFRIADRGHVPLRLVQQKIKKPLRSFQRFSIHADLVPLRIGLRTQFRHHGSVERHPPRRNHLLGFAPRCNSASRHDFLQSFGSHSARILQRGAVVAGLQTGAFLFPACHSQSGCTPRLSCSGTSTPILPNIVIPSTARNLLFSSFFSVSSASNSGFFLHLSHCLPSRSCQPGFLFSMHPLPSPPATGISLAVFPPPSAAPARCASTSPPDAAP